MPIKAKERDPLDMAPPLGDDPTPEDYEWQAREISKLLNGGYTLTTRKACELVRAHRPWVSRYLRPYLKYVTLSSKQARALVAPSKETTWICREDFDLLLLTSIISVTRQTALVPETAVIADEDARNEFLEYARGFEQRVTDSEEEIRQRQRENDEQLDRFAMLAEENPGLEISGIIAELSEEWESLQDELGLVRRGAEEARSKRFSRLAPEDFKEEWGRVIAGLHKRTALERVKWAGDPLQHIEEWRTVSDLKEYGDSDEEVMRGLYVHGAVRVEAVFTAKDGQQVHRSWYFIPPKIPCEEGVRYVIVPADYRLPDGTEIP